VVLEKDGDDQLDRSCERRRIVTKSQEGEEYHDKIKRKLTGLVTFCVGTAF
jgi:hypothetical protein